MQFIGIHRHFRMVNIHRDFNANSPVKCSIPELWEQFSKYYNIEKLEELVSNKCTSIYFFISITNYC